MGLSQGQVKPKTIKLVFVASLLIMQHEGKSKDFARFSGLLEIRFDLILVLMPLSAVFQLYHGDQF
jgi:hypothetical protein